MIAERSAWRANDVVAYDALRDAVGTAIATVFRLAEDGILKPAEAVSEATDIRRVFLDVDAYDRSAIDAARTSLEHQIAHLTGGAT